MYRRQFCKLGAAVAGTLAISKAVMAGGLFKKTSGNKWAVVFGSECGSTKEYANAINEGLGGIAEVIDIEKSTPDVNDYDFFVIGGWRNGSSVKPNNITAFISSNKDMLKDKIKGLFLVVGNNGSTTLSDDITSFLKQKLITPAGVNDDIGKVFFGRSEPACNGFPMAYDNVDPEEGRMFGQKILADYTSTRYSASGARTGLDLSCSSRMLGRNTIIKYSLPQAGNVLLTVCSVNGQRLATLVSKHQNAGLYKVTWDGGNLAPGYYLYRLQVDGKIETKTAQIMK